MAVEPDHLDTDALRASARARGGWRTAAAMVLFALLVGVAVWWLVWTWMIPPAPGQQIDWADDVAVPVWILGFACFAAMRHERRWKWPAKRLAQLIPQVRAGRAPIEALSEEVRGGLAPLVPLVQDLLHELRRQELATAELNEEIRQRVAVRTDALERKLGLMRAQASRDPLTGLYNRRALDTILPRLLERARAESEDLGVLMIDVDSFKPLNDTLGHAAGDALLRDIARLIRSSLGDDDVAVRYGGDEFLVLLPGSTHATTAALAGRLVSLVGALTKSIRVNAPPQLSVGSAQLSEVAAASPQELIEAADRNLYHVKAARRAASARESA